MCTRARSSGPRGAGAPRPRAPATAPGRSRARHGRPDAAGGGCDRRLGARGRRRGAERADTGRFDPPTCQHAPPGAASRRTSTGRRGRTATGCSARSPPRATRASPSYRASGCGGSPAGSSPAPTTSSRFPPSAARSRRDRLDGVALLPPRHRRALRARPSAEARRVTRRHCPPWVAASDAAARAAAGGREELHELGRLARRTPPAGEMPFSVAWTDAFGSADYLRTSCATTGNGARRLVERRVEAQPPRVVRRRSRRQPERRRRASRSNGECTRARGWAQSTKVGASGQDAHRSAQTRFPRAGGDRRGSSWLEGNEQSSVSSSATASWAKPGRAHVEHPCRPRSSSSSDARVQPRRGRDRGPRVMHRTVPGRGRGVSPAPDRRTARSAAPSRCPPSSTRAKRSPSRATRSRTAFAE